MDNKYADRLKMMENKELGDLMRIIGRDDLISFAGGIPSKDIFPVKELNQITEKIMTEKPKEFYQYSSTEGNNPLRDYLAEFLNQRGLDTAGKNIIITTGSQQALDLVAKLFINPNDKVVVEQPGYGGGIGAFKSYQANIKGIPVEKDGINVDLLEKYLSELKQKNEYIKFLYLVPDYSNPSGARLSLAKRKKILALAGEYDFKIIEDTPYSELNYFDERIDYIKKYDSENRVILLGTFSKFFVPGLRVAWVCSNPEFINLLSQAKQNTDLASATPGQLILYQAGISGLLDKQIKRIAPFYRERLEAMGQALDKYFPETADWFQPKGGFFFWVKLPSGMNSRKLLDQAIEKKVAFVTGSSFFVQAEEGYRYMRLSFSDSVPEDIDKGIKILSDLIS